MNLKRIVAASLIGAMTVGLVACSGETKTNDPSSEKKGETAKKVEEVTLNVWASEDEQKIVESLSSEFVEKYKDEVELTVKVSTQSEDDAANVITSDIEGAADIFSIPNDQVAGLVRAGALAEISKDEFKDVVTRNTAGSIQCSSVGDKLYGFPRTADNGYFLYYNTKFLNEKEVLTWETLLAKVAKFKGKKVAMELNSGWYGFGFFRAAGLETSVDEKGNTKCNYNSKTTKIKGVDVATTMINIGRHPAFLSAENDQVESGVASGVIVAAISGTWNAEKISKAWGENYAATKLPTFKCAGQNLQMYSPAGSKIFSVNAKSKSVKWASKLADWLTNEESQIKMSEEKGTGPSNIKAAESEVVKNNKALAAVAMQQQWSDVQYVGNNYWEATKTFGQVCADGNKDKTNPQILLDNMVKAIEAPVK